MKLLGEACWNIGKENANLKVYKGFSADFDNREILVFDGGVIYDKMVAKILERKGTQTKRCV